MPAEEGVGLDDGKGLFPERRRPCQEQEPESVTIADLGAFAMALQDDQLVPEKGILGDTVGLAADGILNRSCDEQVRAGFEAALDADANLLRIGLEYLRSETMDVIEHALMAPGV